MEQLPGQHGSSLPAMFAAAWARLSVTRRVQAGALLVAMMVLLALAAQPVSRGVLELNVSTTAAGQLQVYFDQGQGLSEAASTTLPLPAGRTTLTFPTPAGATQAFRIDPAAAGGGVVIESVTLRGVAKGNPLPVDPQQLQPGVEVTREPAAPGTPARFTFSETAQDPQIQLRTPVPLLSSSAERLQATRLGWALFALSLVVIVALQLGIGHGHLKLAVVALGMVLALSTFAVTSPSVNPDEDLHEADARYFSSHWAPPRIDAPDMQATYSASPYGVSYLSEWNVTYLLAGKFGNLARSLNIDERTGYRLYHAALFALAIGLILVLRLSAAASIPLLVTPQVWYLFSYLNGDALPFAAALIAAALTFAPASRLRTFLAGERQYDVALVMQLLVFIACLAILVVSKRNYWPVAAFITVAAAIVPLRLDLKAVTALAVLMVVGVIGAAGGSALAGTYGHGVPVLAGLAALASAVVLVMWGIGWARSGLSRTPVLRFAGLLTLSLALAAPWVVGDYLKNGAGEQKQQLVDAMREAHAAPAFKPSSTAPAPGLKMRDQGYSLRQLVSAPLEWHVPTFKSFFGVYGYMQYYAAPAYYLAIGSCVALLLLLGVVTTLAQDTLGRRHLVLAAGAAASLIGASFLHSWTYDFQAQGRYILGALILMMPFVFHLRASAQSYLVANLLIAAIFLMGCYSFVRVALPSLTG